MKVRCPKCGSSNVLYWNELVFTEYKKVKRDGNLSKKVYHKTAPELLDTCGYECEECGKMGYFGDGSMHDFEVEKSE